MEYCSHVWIACLSLFSSGILCWVCWKSQPWARGALCKNTRYLGYRLVSLWLLKMPGKSLEWESTFWIVTLTPCETHMSRVCDQNWKKKGYGDGCSHVKPSFQQQFWMNWPDPILAHPLKLLRNSCGRCCRQQLTDNQSFTDGHCGHFEHILALTFRVNGLLKAIAFSDCFDLWQCIFDGFPSLCHWFFHLLCPWWVPRCFGMFNDIIVLHNGKVKWQWEHMPHEAKKNSYWSKSRMMTRNHYLTRASN